MKIRSKKELSVNLKSKGINKKSREAEFVTPRSFSHYLSEE